MQETRELYVEGLLSEEYFAEMMALHNFIEYGKKGDAFEFHFCEIRLDNFKVKNPTLKMINADRGIIAIEGLNMATIVSRDSIILLATFLYGPTEFRYIREATNDINELRKKAKET